MKTLIIAEKPSVARDIGKNLRCNKKGEGYLYSDEYIVSWAVGHLVSLVNPDELDPKYKKWSLTTLPILPDTIPLKVLPKTKKQFTLLKKMLTSDEVDRVICATDAGREGELIFRLIYTLSTSKKPVSRLWISSLTDEAIVEGFKKLQPSAQYDSLYQSALCRAQADWLVGMNASRAFTLVHNALLSIGRVQTPTLGIIVKRQEEINAFVVEEYYTLTAVFDDYSGSWINNEQEKNGRIPTKEEADAIAAQVKNKVAVVQSVLEQDKKELPPQLYDLTSLQRDANRLLGFSAQKTLKVAQSLYETKKAITYPRTDSRYLSKDLIPQVHKTLSLLPNSYHNFVEAITKDKKLAFTKRIVDDKKVTDHHAIIPTPKKVDVTKFSPDEEKVFDLITRRFIAVFYPPYLYKSQEIITLCQEHLFLSRGTVIQDIGWKALYPPKAKKTGGKKTEEGTILPFLNKGDEKNLSKTTVKKEATKPPSPHTEASLLSAMENAGKEIEDEELKEQMKGSGLGTPATRAAIIERLLSVGYVLRKGKALMPTDKGMSLIQVVPPALSSPIITGEWELGLNKIVSGDESPQKFMEDIRAYSASLVEAAKKSSRSDVVFEQEHSKGKKRTSSTNVIPNLTCPVCQKGQVTENQKAFACSHWKEGCHFTLWKNALSAGGGPMLTEKIVTLLLTTPQVQGSTGVLAIQNGKLFFTPKNASVPFSCPLEYIKKKTT